MNGGSRPSAVLLDAEPVADDLAERCRAHLARVLASPALANAPVQQRFLRFVVEETLAGRGDDLKEYVIASEVLGRGATYNPHEDAAVRVAARRLRQKLHEYYEGEGRDDTVRIILRAGSYRPAFEEAPAAAAAPSEAPDPAGPQPSPEVTADTRGRIEASASRRLPVVIALAVVAAAVGGGLWWLGATGIPRPHVVVVLPFQNATHDPANDIVCFGLVEELTTQLTQADGLRVIARTSAMQFAGQGDVRAAARHLGATAVIEGSVRGDDHRLRITAQLIRARDGAHVWARTYDRATHDPLAMQDEVAREVADEVTSRLAARREVASGRPRPPASAVAAYWRGRYQRSLRTPEGRRAALEHFEAAIAAGPAYGEAFAAAGEVLATMSFHAEVPPGEGVARARAASQRAIALDPRLGLAHATLGWIAFFADRDWPAAERAYRRAIELNPSDADARQMYAHGLASRGRFDDAVAESEVAVGLDPLSYAASADLAVVLYLARRYDDCVARAQRVVDAHPQAINLLGVLGVCEVARGRFAEGRAHLDTMMAGLGRLSFALARQAQACAAGGEVAAARALVAELEALTSRGDGAFSHLALAHTALGNRDRALEALATAVERCEGDTAYLAVEPAFDALRRDERFIALLRRLHLPV